MRLVLLGHNGQLGSDLKRVYEARRNIEVVSIGRDQLDLSQPDRVGPILSEAAFDVLVNCASYHQTDEIERDPGQAFAVNAYAVREMARVCRDKGAKFFHISTDYVFDGLKKNPYIETDSLRPLNVYGASKALGETLATVEHDQVYVVRVASLFGMAGASGKGGNFVEKILRRARTDGEVRVVDDIVMSPSSTADVSGMIAGLIRNSVAPGIYHAVNSGQTSWYEFAREAVERAGIVATVKPIKSSEYGAIALRPQYSVLSNEKISAIVGEIPHWSDALDRYLRAMGHRKRTAAVVG